MSHKLLGNVMSQKQELQDRLLESLPLRKSIGEESMFSIYFLFIGLENDICLSTSTAQFF